MVVAGRGRRATALLLLVLVSIGTALVGAPALAFDATQHEVTATVVDEQGLPVDGMVEVFEFWDDGFGGYFDVYDYVDVEDGRFSVRVPNGQYTFLVRGDGTQLDEWFDGAHSLETATVLNIDGTGADLGAIELSWRPMLTGRLVDEDGDPASGVEVALVDAERSQVALATSDEAGRYVLTDVPQGEYRVRFADLRRPGTFASEWFSDRRSFAAADAVAFDGVTDLDLGRTVLQRGGALSGRVTGAGGAGLSHVTVTAYDPGNEVERETVTDADGRWRLTRLPAGDHVVGFSDTLGDYRSSYYAGSTSPLTATPVGLADGAEVTGVDQQLARRRFREPPGTAILGRTRTTGGAPLAGIRVEAVADTGPDGAPEVVASDLSDRRGRWFLTRLPPGGYRVAYSDPHHPRDRLAHVREYHADAALLRDATVLRVAAGRVADAGVATLRRHAGLGGRVTDEDGVPLAGTAVVTAHDVDGTPVARERTDARGRYHLERLLPGRYRVLVEGDSPTTSYVRQWFGRAWSFADADAVRVRSGRTRWQVDVALDSRLVALERPSVHGRAAVGEVLRGRHGTFSLMADVRFAYRWLRDGVVVGRERTYRVRRTDRGDRLRLVVRASVRDLSGWARSRPSDVVRR